MDLTNIDDLVKKAKKGDTVAFSKLYEFIHKDLYKTAYYILGSAQDAEDVVSETVINAFETLPLLRNNKAFKSWIYKILTNKCQAILKSYVNKNLALEDERYTYENNFSEEMLDIRDAFMRLPHIQRTVLSLSLYSGYNSKEISKLLYMNQNTVRSVKQRGLEQLRYFLNYDKEEK